MYPDINYDEFVGERLVSIRGIDRSVSQRGSISYDYLIFEFTSASLIFKANIDTDEIIVRRRSAAKFRKWESVPELESFLGRKTLRSWTNFSHNGACDMFVFAFEDAQPALALYVMASSIKIYEIKPIFADTKISKNP